MKIRTVRSSGTIRPCEVYCSISRPKLPVLGDLPEDVAHRDVDQVGKLAEHGPLGPLAAAGHAEQQDGCDTWWNSRPCVRVSRMWQS